MAKPASKAAAKQFPRPKLGTTVIVRSTFFRSPAVGIVAGLYDDDTQDVIVQVFPVGRDSLQIPMIPYFLTEPDSSVKSAAWPA